MIFHIFPICQLLFAIKNLLLLTMKILSLLAIKYLSMFALKFLSRSVMNFQLVFLDDKLYDESVKR